MYQYAARQLIALALVLFVGALVAKQHFVVNVTESLPYGVYYIERRPFEIGDIVAVCPPDNELTRTAYERGYIHGGDCPGGYGYILKKILAAKRDAIEITSEGTFVNGEKIQNSTPLKVDGDGFPLPNLTGKKYLLEDNEVFCLSDFNPYSFDGRYYGPVDAANIKHVLTMFYTWE